MKINAKNNALSRVASLPGDRGRNPSPSRRHPLPLLSPLVVPRGSRREAPRAADEGDGGTLAHHGRVAVGRDCARHRVGSAARSPVAVSPGGAESLRRLRGDSGLAMTCSPICCARTTEQRLRTWRRRHPLHRDRLARRRLLVAALGGGGSRDPKPKLVAGGAWRPEPFRRRQHWMREMATEAVLPGDGDDQL